MIYIMLIFMGAFNAYVMFVPEEIISRRAQCYHFALFVCALFSIALKRTLVG